MKQKITASQFQELTLEQQKKLNYLKVFSDSPLLDNDQMMCILYEKGFDGTISLDFSGTLQDINLCDKLWTAVKEILQGDEEE